MRRAHVFKPLPSGGEVGVANAASDIPPEFPTPGPSPEGEGRK
jgi:hypothetical protein